MNGPRRVCTCNSLICFCSLATRDCSSSSLAAREEISLSLRWIVCSSSFLLRSRSDTASCVNFRSPSTFRLAFSTSPLHTKRNQHGEIVYRGSRSAQCECAEYHTHSLLVGGNLIFLNDAKIYAGICGRPWGKASQAYVSLRILG